jgi:hypothetical protein
MRPDVTPLEATSGPVRAVAPVVDYLEGSSEAPGTALLARRAPVAEWPATSGEGPGHWVA